MHPASCGDRRLSPSRSVLCLPPLFPFRCMSSLDSCSCVLKKRFSWVIASQRVGGCPFLEGACYSCLSSLGLRKRFPCEPLPPFPLQRQIVMVYQKYSLAGQSFSLTERLPFALVETLLLPQWEEYLGENRLAHGYSATDDCFLSECQISPFYPHHHRLHHHHHHHHHHI